MEPRLVRGQALVLGLEDGLARDDQAYRFHEQPDAQGREGASPQGLRGLVWLDEDVLLEQDGPAVQLGREPVDRASRDTVAVMNSPPDGVRAAVQRQQA